MTKFTQDQYWKTVLRPPALAQRRAMHRDAHLYALPGVLALIAVPIPHHEHIDTLDLPERVPTGTLIH